MVASASAHFGVIAGGIGSTSDEGVRRLAMFGVAFGGDDIKDGIPKHGIIVSCTAEHWPIIADATATRRSC